MTRVLVVYGTTEGHTAKIAAAVADALRARGVEVDVARAGEARVHPDDYSGVVVAASVHGGRYQAAVRRWVQAHAGALARKPTAFISVCLGVLQKDPRVQAELTAIADRFFTLTGWRPMTTKIVAGALLYTRYNWFIRWVMKRIVRKAGGDLDTTRDYEYTDWADLKAFAEQFGRSVLEPHSEQERAIPGRARCVA